MRTNWNVFPLMLLVCSVDTPIHINRSHLLPLRCASRPASCVDWASPSVSSQNNFCHSHRPFHEPAERNPTDKMQQCAGRGLDNRWNSVRLVTPGSCEDPSAPSQTLQTVLELKSRGVGGRVAAVYCEISSCGLSVSLAAVCFAVCTRTEVTCTTRRRWRRS